MNITFYNKYNIDSASTIYFLVSGDTDTSQDCWIFGVNDAFKANIADLDFNNIFKFYDMNISAIYIAREAFKDCKTLKTVTFDSRVKLIEEDAFANCSLTSITFARGTTPELRRGCFRQTDKLESITNMFFIPETPNTFLGHIFGATSTINVTCVPDTLQKVTMQTALVPKCFAGCESIKEVSWPKITTTDAYGNPINTTRVPFEAFSGCSRLEKAYCEEAATVCIGKDEEGKEIFGRIKGLLDLDSTVYIDDNAFRGCNALDTAFVPMQKIYFGTDCFRECYGLVRIFNGTANSGLSRYIEAGSTDYGCIGLYALNIIDRGQGTELADWLKQKPSSLTDPEIGVAILKVQKKAENGEPYTEKYLIGAPENCDIGSLNITHIRTGFGIGLGIEEITLPDTLIAIGDFAFTDCTGLKKIKNKSKVLKTIGKSCFKNCAINEIETPDAQDWCNIQFGWPQYIYEDVIKLTITPTTEVYSLTDQATWPCYPTSSGSINLMSNAHFFSKIKLQGAVKTIPARTFYNCYELTEVTGSTGSIESIGVDAFYNCPIDYTSVEYSDQTACGVKTIGSWIFGPTKNDTDWTDDFKGYKKCFIDLTNPCHFYADAFKNCSTLEEIHIIGNLNNWFKSTFDNAYSNPLYTENGEPRYLYVNGEKVTQVEITDASTVIGPYVGAGLILDSFIFTGVTEATICKQIDENAFTGCKIKKVECLPSTVKQLKNDFLEEITIYPCTINNKQDNVIAYDALKNCSKLKTVVFGAPVSKSSNDIYLGIQKIGADAFYGCPNINLVHFDGVFSSPRAN